jgi:hypothetical protein
VKQDQPKKKAQPPAAEGALKGWTAIARYLGIPVATASEGMPVRREGRFTVADRDAISAWLGRESHMPKPAHVMTEDADMAAAQRVDCGGEEAGIRTKSHHGRADLGREPRPGDFG